METAVAVQDHTPRAEVSAPPPQALASTNEGLGLRYAQVLLFVGLWVSLGFTLELDPNVYLLLGVPLAIAFQVWVRRRPIRDLWVRDGAPFRLGKLGLVLAVALLIVPGKELVGALSRQQWIPAAWLLAAALGAIAAAYSVTQFTRATTRQFFLCLATAGTAGVVMMAGAAAARSVGLQQPFQPNIGAGLKWLMLYFPVCFLLEEVAFRGVIDAHVHAPNARRGFWSAVGVSVLWGLWHWPVVPHAGVPWWGTALQLIIVHTLIGVPLSIFWRRSGNLAVPGFTHAFIDGVRNALLRP